MIQLDWIEAAQARQRQAQETLARMVEKQAKSFEIEQYRRKREASKKGWATRAARGRAFVNGAASVSALRASIPVARRP